VWAHLETYIIIIAALASAGGGIYVLDQGLQDYEAIYLVAIYQAFLIIIGSLSGIIFFHETAGMDAWWQSCVYPLSIITTVAGVIILSEKHKSGDAVQDMSAKVMEEGIPLMKTNGSAHGSVTSL
jgi:magnesium transporter